MTEVVGLARALVAVDSVNPALVAGGAGEAEAAALVTAWGTEEGLDVDVVGPPERPSVVVRARGTGGGRTLLLCGHLDTVGVAGMTDPFAGRVEGDRLYGRGAYDMKGGLAAALVACARAASLGLAGDVVVAAVADEEHASLGVQAVLETVTADAAIVVEPTEGAVAIAHKGFAWVEVDVPGRAAHGSRPHLGVDAIVAAAPVLTRLGELDARLESATHPLVGRASVHASTIAGGEELSSYPASCTLAYERRTLPGETQADVEAEAAALIEGVDSATARVTLVREPFALDPDHWLVAAAGGNPVGVSYWADSAFIAAAEIPTVLLGPAGEGAHAIEEWVSVASLETLADRLVAITGTVCA